MKSRLRIRLRLNFDSMTCLNYLFLYFFQYRKSQADSQAVSRAVLQAVFWTCELNPSRLGELERVCSLAQKKLLSRFGHPWSLDALALSPNLVNKIIPGYTESCQNIPDRFWEWLDEMFCQCAFMAWAVCNILRVIL